MITRPSWEAGGLTLRPTAFGRLNRRPPRRVSESNTKPGSFSFSLMPRCSSTAVVAETDRHHRVVRFSPVENAVARAHGEKRADRTVRRLPVFLPLPPPVQRISAGVGGTVNPVGAANSAVDSDWFLQLHERPRFARELPVVRQQGWKSALPQFLGTHRRVKGR